MTKSSKPSWIWLLYFIIYLVYVALATAVFFNSDSPIYFYYHALMGVGQWFLLPYLMNCLAVILNILALFPFYCYIFKINVFGDGFWKIFFAARLIMDLTGRSYEFLTIKSLCYQDLQAVLSLLGILAILTLPSYAAIYLYAFRRRALFPVDA